MILHSEPWDSAVDHTLCEILTSHSAAWQISQESAIAKLLPLIFSSTLSLRLAK